MKVTSMVSLALFSADVAQALGVNRLVALLRAELRADFYGSTPTFILWSPRCRSPHLLLE
ncbi:hypothetical protein [Gilvimarinus agarilyticus]|uniref:hypothetical protein n=1 Tax=Gilvimarinus agarilyticus TaxID=679259 RepID=UPI0012FB4F54|nr:hypothetical protein [Gilvimarinus agarilyticus]